MKRPLIAVPVGDPAGIGPEIAVKAAADEKVIKEARCVVIGSKDIIEQALEIADVHLRINLLETPEDGVYEEGILNLIDLNNVDMQKFAFGKVSGMCGRAAYEYIAKSIELANEGKVDAVATAPINKEALRSG